MKKIVFTGGGTAGHIMPNLAIIENLKNHKIYYLGSNGMEKQLISKYPDITYIEIPVVKFVRSLTPKNLLIPFKLIKSINYCKKILKDINPDIIFSKGGYVSIPVCIAGSKLQIPTLTHESDLTVGLANKIIAKKAKYLCCSFRETANSFGKNAIYTGSPIRNSILHGNKNTIISRHKINTKLPIILIVGGSLGAQAINECIWQNIQSLTKKYYIIHITGKNNINNNLKNTPNYIQIEFANDIQNYFALSDMVISRAGSNTIFELLALKKPMLLIPLSKKSSRGDQILNAQNFKNNRIAKVILQEDLSSQTLQKGIEDCLNQKETLIKNMSSVKFANGNEKIINLIAETAKNNNN